MATARKRSGETPMIRPCWSRSSRDMAMAAGVPRSDAGDYGSRRLAEARQVRPARARGLPSPPPGTGAPIERVSGPAIHFVGQPGGQRLEPENQRQAEQLQGEI